MSSPPFSEYIAPWALDFCQAVGALGNRPADDLWWCTRVADKDFAVQALLDGKRVTSPGSLGRQLRQCLQYVHRGRLMASTRLRRRIAARLPDYHGQTLVITFLDRRSWTAGGDPRDPYWQHLLDHLNERGQKVIRVGHTVEDEHVVAAQLDKQDLSAGDTPCLPIEAFQTTTDCFAALWQAQTARIAIDSPLTVQGQDITARLNEILDDDRTNGHLLIELIRRRALRRMVQLLQPTRILWPWENHVWERQLCQVARAEAPACRLVGHQHSILRLSQLNHFPGSGERHTCPLPDKILTSGPLSARMMTSLGHYPDGVVESGAAIRYEYLRGITMRATPIATPLRLGLATPIELDDSLGIIDSLTAHLQAHAEHTAFLRCHPALPLERIKAASTGPWPANLIPSTAATMSEFLGSIDILCYYKSTICLEAAAAGVAAISIDPGEDAAMHDPMAFCQAGHRSAANPDELSGAIQAFTSLTPEELAAERRAARAFVDSCFTLPTPENLDRFLTC